MLPRRTVVAHGVVQRQQFEISLHTKHELTVVQFIRSMVEVGYHLAGRYVRLDGTQPTVLTFIRPDAQQKAA